MTPEGYKDFNPIDYIKSLGLGLEIIALPQDTNAERMDVKQYQNIVDTMNLLKILSIGENDIRNKKMYTHEELQEKIEKILD